MSNLIFGFPNLIDAATLSGGSWTGADLTKIQNRYLRDYAISADLDPASTRLDIALAKSYLVRVLAIPSHNLTVNATIRIQASEDSGFGTLAYDSTAIPAWIAPNSSQVDWEADVDYGLYRPTDADIGFRAWCAVHCMPDGVQARYWRVLIDDGANAEGVVKIGRVFIGGGFVASINPSYGASLSVETATEVDLASSGHESFRRKEPYRVFRFDMGMVSDERAISRHLEMLLRAGIDREVMAVLYPEATRDQQRQAFMGRIRRLGAIDMAHFDLNGIGYEIKELQ